MSSQHLLQYKNLELALKKALELKQPVLFSYTEKIETFHSLAVYNQFSAKKGERFFWENAQKTLSLIGVGIATSIRCDTDNYTDRFVHVEHKWNEMIQYAVIQNNYEANGTGPTLFGGFSFDQETVQETEWAPFEQALFYLPQYMYTKYNEDYYLTYNIWCHPEDNLAALEEKLTNNPYKASVKQNHLPKLKGMTPFQPSEWKQAVQTVVDEMNTTSLEKVVLARKLILTYDTHLDPSTILTNLSQQQNNGYLFSLESFDACFLGASPERLVLKDGNEVLSTCLAGSIKRGHTEVEDEALGKTLLNDQKNVKEHEHVVHMISTVFNQLCDKVNVPNAPTLLKLADIQHLYTPVTGKVSTDEYSILNFVKALHPTPALGGSPREDAMKWIRELENMDRGLYGAPVGWMDYRGNGEFIVAIRSALVNKDHAYLYAGCGVVKDSNAAEEFEETNVKFRPMLRALGGVME